MRTIIVCRARVSRACLHGQPSRKQFGAGYMEGVPDPPLSEDGTFDGESICCDPCYVALGGPLRDEVNPAIERWRQRRAASGE